MEEAGGELEGRPEMKPQLVASTGMPDRQAVHRRRERVQAMLHELPESAQEAIREQYADSDAQAGGPSRNGTTRQTARSGATVSDDRPTDIHPRITDDTPDPGGRHQLSGGER
jgi:phospholipid/cholesterol/gamma-HCH transport system ATP-binding protein